MLFTDSGSGGKSYQSSRRVQGQSLGSSERSRSSPLSKVGGDFSFKEFLWQHIDMALTKGFDDNVGRHQVAANFEVKLDVLSNFLKGGDLINS